MIRYYKNGEKGIRELKGFEKNCWISVTNPTDTQLEYLTKEYDLEKNNLIAGLDVHEIPRLDKGAKGNIYVFVNSPSPEMQTFLIVIGKKFILTLSEQEPYFVRDLIEGRTRIKTDRPKKTMLTIIKEVAKSHEQVSLRMVKEISRHKKGTKELRDNDLLDLLEKENTLNEYVTSYYYMTLLCERILDKMKLKADNQELLKDIVVENKQGFNMCRSALKTLKNIKEYYNSILTNKLNRTIKILTVFTIFLAIPATIGGLMGMNLRLPLQQHPFAFGFVLLFVLMLWTLFFTYLRRKKVI